MDANKEEDYPTDVNSQVNAVGPEESAKVIENIANRLENMTKGSAIQFSLKLENGKGQKLRRNIKIHGEQVIFKFHFYFGPNDYQESLKTLRVVSRMPAGFFPKKNSHPRIFLSI